MSGDELCTNCLTSSSLGISEHIFQEMILRPCLFFISVIVFKLSRAKESGKREEGQEGGERRLEEVAFCELLIVFGRVMSRVLICIRFSCE